MSLRGPHSESSTARCFRVTLVYGGGTRSISIKPLLFYILAGVLPVLGLWYLFASVYFIFRDDMLASLMTRQAEMQYGYEDRISGLRAQIDQLTSHRLLDEAALSTKMQDLVSRQARLEQRSVIVTSLAERVLLKSQSASAANHAPAVNEAHAKQSVQAQTPNPLVTGTFSAPLPQGVSAFAPTASAPPSPPFTKPNPETFELRHTEDSNFDAPAPTPDQTSDARDPASDLPRMTATLDRIETNQNRIMARLQAPLSNEMARFKTALAEAGLSADRLPLRPSYSADDRKIRDAIPKAAAKTAVGGPFVPLKLDAEAQAFEREAVSLQDAILAVEHLRRAISSVPLRKPLLGDPDITSGFGARIDPFLGRPAMHTGVDLREDYGTGVHATAAGKVTIAGPDGGYGNMVEVDHGNGLSTRYAHLSAISVSEGETVEVGQIVGRIGATGRATGPHLHYETRIDGEPVDPIRFLKAGARLFSEPAAMARQN